MYLKMKEDLIAKHEAEKEGALEEQKQKYEEELARLKEQLEMSSVTSSPPQPQPPTFTT